MTRLNRYILNQLDPLTSVIPVCIILAVVSGVNADPKILCPTGLTTKDRIDAVLFEKVESLHREVNRQAQEIKDGCERDIRKVDERLRIMEKKMWSIFGGLAIISFVVSPIGQKVVGAALTPAVEAVIIPQEITLVDGSS